MHKVIRILTVVLVIQVVLAVLLNVQSFNQQSSASDKPLLASSMETIDKIKITGQNEASVLLVKTDGQWKLPEYFNMPANTSKLSEFMNKLKAMSRTWPVATTSSAQKRFEVGDNNFQRKLELFHGEALKATVFTGTSPDYRKVYARLKDADEIFSVAFSNFEASLESEDWMDKNILQLPKENLSRIKTEDFMLAKKDKVWEMENLKENETLQQDKALTFVNNLSHLTVEAALGDTLAEEYQQGKPLLTVEAWLNNSSDPVQWKISAPAVKDYYIVKSSTNPAYFKVSKLQGDKLVDAKRSSLISILEKTAEKTSEAENSQEETGTGS